MRIGMTGGVDRLVQFWNIPLYELLVGEAAGISGAAVKDEQPLNILRQTCCGIDAKLGIAGGVRRLVHPLSIALYTPVLADSADKSATEVRLVQPANIPEKAPPDRFPAGSDLTSVREVCSLNIW